MSGPTQFAFGERQDVEHRPRYRAVGPLPTYWRVICAVCDGLVAEVDYGLVRPGRGMVLYHRGRVGWDWTEAAEPPAPPPDSWIVTHPRGFRLDDEGRYRVIRDVAVGDNQAGDRKHALGGARRMEGGPPNVVAQKGWGIVGEFPTLPATILCPDCQRRHWVEPPPG